MTVQHLSFTIVKQEHPVSARPYRILEFYMSSDGPRTRICDGTWKDYHDAKESLDRLERREA